MYITFIDYFLEREMPVMTDARKNYVDQFIYDSFNGHANSEFAGELYSRDPLCCAMVCDGGDDITVWLYQSGRDTMKHAMDDLMACLDARDCVDWSRIPIDCGGTRQT